MRFALLPFLLACAIAAGSTLATPPARANDDRVASPPIDTGPFRSIQVSGYAEVVLVQGERESVEVEGTPKRRATARVRNEDGRLTITAGEEAPWWSLLVPGQSSRPLRITVHFRALDTVALSGAVKMSAAALAAPALRVRASGAASVQIDALDSDDFRFDGSGAVKGAIAGRATRQEIAISGAGEFKAARLVSEHAEVRVSGAGRVVVNAGRTLDASISGAGAIDYVGSPEVRQRISGAGRIRQVSSRDEDVAVRGPFARTAASVDG